MANVLFICRSNAGRSQAAEFLFKEITAKHAASSAGSTVKEEGREGTPAGRMIVEIAAESGIDISAWKRKQVTTDMVQHADKVVVLMQKGEVDRYLPDYIKSSGKVEYWPVEDMRDTDMDFHRSKVSEIKDRVIELVKRLDHVKNNNI